MSKRILNKVTATCVTDNMSPYFEGKCSLEEALQDATETFIACYRDSVFKCGICGNVVYPKIKTDEHGIYIISTRSEARGGFANMLLKKNICDKCLESMNLNVAT